MESKPQFNKDQMTQEELSAWVEKKQDQRETVNALADRQLADVFSDPQELNAHLKRQATFGKMGVTNVLLIGAQNVEPSYSCSARAFASSMTFCWTLPGASS